MSKLLIKGIAVAIAAIVMVSVSAGAAQAQSCGYGGYGGYGGHGGHIGGHRSGIHLQIGNVGYSNFGYAQSYNYRPAYNVGPAWHDTSHLHYHGPSVTRHRNHYHVTPGHNHLHRSGHWHW